MALNENDCIKLLTELAKDSSTFNDDGNTNVRSNVENINSGREGKLDQLARLLSSRDFTDLHTGID